MILKNAKLNNVFVKPVLPKIFMLNPTIIGPKYSPISYIIINSDVAKAISVTLILSPRYAKVTVYKLVEAKPLIIKAIIINISFEFEKFNKINQLTCASSNANTKRRLLK